MNGFSPWDAEAFFEDLGCPLKVERGNRVFPVSDKSLSVLQALERAMKEAGVTLRKGRVRHIRTENGAVVGVSTDREDYDAPAVILATGGCSYPATGSTGDGYTLTAALGHRVVPPRGSLVPLEERGSWCAKLQGLSLRNVNVTLLDQKGKRVHEEFGELLFTHFGLSGPTVLSLSAHMDPAAPGRILIDLKPALDEAALDARLLRDFGANQNKTFEHALTGLFPRTLIPVMVERSGIPGDLRVNAVTKVQRRTLLELTKAFPVDLAGPRPVEEAIITAGGVSVREVHPKTMESRLVSGLYLAGELLDCDAYTGGYNLQIAWATGHAAGAAC